MKLHHDARVAIRSLVRSPAFTITAVVCLALGVGVDAAMFRVADALLLSPPPHVRDADRLVRVYVEKTYPGIGPFLSGSFAYPAVRRLAENAESLSPAAYHRTEVTVGRGADARRTEAVLAGPQLFDVLGAEPALGRWPTVEESRPGAIPEVATVGHGFWRERLGGDPSVVGSVLDVAGRSVTVVGVAPPGFTGAELEAVDLWLPLGMLGHLQSSEWHQNEGAKYLALVARLAPGVTSERAASEITALVVHGEGGGGSSDSAGRAVLGPLLEARGPYVSREVRMAEGLSGLALLVLLIACANVANLHLARSLAGRRDVAVRMAMGASRWDVARRRWIEALIVSVLGAGAAGLALVWVDGLLRTYLVPGAPPPSGATVGRLVLATTTLALASGFLVGLPASIHAWRHDLRTVIGSADGGSSPRRRWLQSGLLVLQVALGLVLLAGTGLFLESLRGVGSIEIGMDVDRVVVAHADLRGEDLPALEQDAMYRRMERHAASLEGVTATALAAGVPLDTTFGVGVSAPGGATIPSLPTGGPYVHPVTPGFFETMGIEVLRGRRFEEGLDSSSGEAVVVVNETMAEQVWPGEEALGRCLYVGAEGAPCARVVGVSEDTLWQRLGEGPTMQLYVPLGQAPERLTVPGALLVRGSAPVSTEDRDGWAAAVRQHLHGTRSDLPFIEVRPLASLLDPQLRPWRLGSRVLGLFGAVAWVLAALGAYSLMLFAVTQRTRELGIRMALGADRLTVMGDFVGRAVKIAVLGSALGLVLVLLAGRFVRPLLYQVTPGDPLVLAVAALTIALAVVSASILPAWRGAAVDPARSLRDQ